MQSCSQVHSDAWSYENTRCKSCRGEIMGKLEKIPAWQQTKVRNEKCGDRRSMEQGPEQFILRHWWISVIWIIRRRSHKFKSRKGELYSQVTLWKDDSGSYAVFTEQGSPASQMTAAKVMDSISRLPGFLAQAANAVSSWTQVKMEDAPALIENSKVRMSRYFDTSTKTQMALKHGPETKTQSFLLSGICTVIILWQEYQGKRAIWKSSYWNTVENKFRTGNVYSLTERKDYYCLCMWTISNWLERNRT